MTETERSYYLEAADFDGYVSKARQELKGLTEEHYQNWFIARSLAYYRVCEATARSNKGLFMQLSARNSNGWKLLQRRQGRLYIRRKVSRVKEGLTLALWGEERGLKNIYEGGKSVAADPIFFIATDLKRIAASLCSETDILRKARLSPTACKGSYELNPDFGDDNELFTGIRIATIRYFQRLLAEFEIAVLQPASSGVMSDTIDGLLIGYTEQSLTNLLVSVGLLVDAQTRAHSQDSKPRTWRAVVEALRQRKYLEAGGDAVALWKALNKAYGPAPGQLPSKRNLQDDMIEHNALAKLAFSRAFTLLPIKV